MPTIPVVVEVGAKRAFASALAWPGWSRSGRDEEAALDALLSYGTRYRAVVVGRVRSFAAPRSRAAFEVVERVPGNATTEFGAPGVAASLEAEAPSTRELRRLEAILGACWDNFDQVVDGSRGRTLRPGPRGGGRGIEKIRGHVLEADLAYLRALGGSAPAGVGPVGARASFVEALGERARGELPDVGPRGGARWSARYAARRSAWHILDHTWEIEDRS